MFDDNNANDDEQHSEDSQTTTEYVVFFGGEEYDVFEDETEAGETADALARDNPFVNVKVEPQEVEPRENTYNPYDFVADDGDEEGPTATPVDPENDVGVRRWTLGDHTMTDESVRESLNAALDGMDEEVDADLRGALMEAASMVSQSGVTGFECPVCGLNHSHGDHKHDIRDIFGVSAEFADRMEYNPYCHCGVNELAMLVDFYPYINAEVFEGIDYSAVEKVAPGALTDVLRRWREDSSRTISQAVDAAERGDEVPRDNDTRDAMKGLFERINRIKSAANSAPISSETRQTIDEHRASLEERLDLA